MQENDSSKVSTNFDRNALKEGDLIYFAKPQSNGEISSTDIIHVIMVTGDNEYIHEGSDISDLAKKL